eukprot:1153653_1
MAEVINCPGRTIGFNERVFLDPVCSMSPLTDPIQVPRDHPIKALRLPEAHGSSEPNVGSSESDGFVGRNNARIPKAVRNRQTAVFTPPDSPQGIIFQQPLTQKVTSRQLMKHLIVRLHPSLRLDHRGATSQRSPKRARRPEPAENRRQWSIERPEMIAQVISQMSLAASPIQSRRNRNRKPSRSRQNPTRRSRSRAANRRESERRMRRQLVRAWEVTRTTVSCENHHECNVDFDENSTFFLTGGVKQCRYASGKSAIVDDTACAARTA